jgi:hypothetical protein
VEVKHEVCEQKDRTELLEVRENKKVVGKRSTFDSPSVHLDRRRDRVTKIGSSESIMIEEENEESEARGMILKRMLREESE